MSSIFSQIASGAVTVWNDISTALEADWAKVKAALGSEASVLKDTALADIKQGASDLLSDASAGLTADEQGLITGAESLADKALLSLTGGFALPLVPATNAVIDGLVSKGVSALQAWALKQKAALAENTAAQHGGTPPAV